MKRILALIIAATFLCIALSACFSSSTANTEPSTESITETPTEDETIAPPNSGVKWERVSFNTYTKYNNECLALRVYVPETIDNYQAADLYREVIAKEDPNDSYYAHTVFIYYDRAGADGTGIADATIEQLGKGSIAAEMKYGGKDYIITDKGKLIEK